MAHTAGMGTYQTWTVIGKGSPRYRFTLPDELLPVLREGLILTVQANDGNDALPAGTYRVVHVGISFERGYTEPLPTPPGHYSAFGNFAHSWERHELTVTLRKLLEPDAKDSRQTETTDTEQLE